MYKTVELSEKGSRIWMIFIATGIFIWIVSTVIAFTVTQKIHIYLFFFLPWHSFFIRIFLLLMFLVSGYLVARTSSQLEKTEQKIITLHKWARKLNQASNVDKILEYTMNAMENTLGFENAFIALKQDTLLTIEKAVGMPIPQHFRDVPLDEEVLGKRVLKAFQQGKSVLIKDLSNHNKYFSISPHIKSKLTVPIKTEEDVMGVLEVGNKKREVFDDQDKRLLEILAAHVAVAIKKVREKEQRVSLERLDELRNRFIAMITHEIGSPLTPIKTELEMLQHGYHGELQTEQHEEIKGLLEKVDRLTGLVEEFRQTSKLRSERITLATQKHRLIDTIEKALEGYQEVLGEKEILMMKRIQQPLTIEYDEDRMVQVMRNLVKNAIDYTDDTIVIRGGEEEEKIWVSVEDNGQGIPKKHQEKIFEPFNQVERKKLSKNKKFGGTGLGLYICKQIIAAHGGEITVDSTPDKGTTFTIHIPKGKKIKTE